MLWVNATHWAHEHYVNESYSVCTFPFHFKTAKEIMKAHLDRQGWMTLMLNSVGLD